MISSTQYFYQGNGEFQQKKVEGLKAIEDQQVEINPLRVGICGTDLYHFETYQGQECHLGHEWIGRVKRVGARVSTFKPGDLVTSAALLGCGSCEACSSLDDNFCLKPVVMGSEKIGAMREVLVLEDRHVKLLSHDENDLESLVLLEVLAVGVQALDELKTLTTARGRCLIMGAGSVGLSLAMMAQAEGYEPIVIDVLKFRVDRAKNLGLQAFHTNELLLDSSWQHQFPVIFDASGDHAGATGAFKSIPYFSHRHASVIIIAKYKQAFQFNPTTFGLLALKVHWIRGVKNHIFYKTINDWKDHDVLKKLRTAMISHVVPVKDHTDITQAFELAQKQSTAGKVILNFERS